MSKVATDYRYTELGRIRVTLSITYSTHPPNDKWDKTTLKKSKNVTCHIMPRSFLLYRTTPTLACFVSMSTFMWPVEIFSRTISFSLCMMSRTSDISPESARMINWVVDEVQGRLIVQVDLDKGRDCSIAFHLELELTMKADLLPCHCESHVLAFAGA